MTAKESLAFIAHAVVVFILSSWLSSDTLLDMLTVKEMLMYTADLKRSTKESRKAKEAVVD